MKQNTKLYFININNKQASNNPSLLLDWLPVSVKI